MAINFLIIMRLLGVLAILIGIGGCATSVQNQVYDPIGDRDFQGPALKAARSVPNAFVGSRVRWGGNITQVENRRDATLVEVVEHPLSDNGYPLNTSESQGRFVAQIPGFLDPAIYAEGRQITVVGTLKPSVQRKIGEYPYEFPVVAVDKYQLWEPRRDVEVIYNYDPFWDPFWSGSQFYPWGWYPRFYYRHR